MSTSTEPAYDVCVLGLGYVGLPTATVLATHGMRVLGVDARIDVVQTIAAGNIHIVEPELDALVRAAVAHGSLQVAASPAPARAYLICVPTPLTPDQQPDLSAVEAAARAVANVAQPGALVVLESTVPPGTTRNLVASILAERGLVAGDSVFVAHAPERVLPGAVIREVVDNPRVVGGVTDACTHACVQFYERFVRGRVHGTRAELAELVKLTENAYRDVNIAFANELANVCEHLGLDVWDAIRLANEHPRVDVLHPGPGVGGHCIAVDPWFIVASAPHHTPLLRTARAVNDQRPLAVLERVNQLVGRFDQPRIACLGLSYKADIDDVRESPALFIARQLHATHRERLLLNEPHLQRSPIANTQLVDVEVAVNRADIIVILVAHRAYRSLEPRLARHPAVIDAPGLLKRRIS